MNEILYCPSSPGFGGHCYHPAGFYMTIGPKEICCWCGNIKGPDHGPHAPKVDFTVTCESKL